MGMIKIKNPKLTDFVHAAMLYSNSHKKVFTEEWGRIPGKIFISQIFVNQF